MPWLDQVIFENTIRQWLFALGVLLLSYLVVYIVLRVLIRRLAKAALATRNNLDDFLTSFFDGTKSFFTLSLGLYLASLFLTLPERVSSFLRVLIIIAALVQAGFWGMSLINYLVWTRMTRQEQEGEIGGKTTLSALGLVAKIVLWSVLALLILENLTGIQVDTLIASLGIGGIAVALAVQNILGDLFSALTIALDKPFEIGDMINVGEFSGAVEHVGLKSTRVRSLTGEQLVFANSDLLSSRIRNYKRMQRRRIAFNVGVVYQTPHDKLAAIPGMLQEIIVGRPEVTFDRAHLRSFDDFAVIYEIVYFMENPDLLLYMDTQQSINLEIFKRFEAQGIEFAYPTQTVFVERDD